MDPTDPDPQHCQKLTDPTDPDPEHWLGEERPLTDGLLEVLKDELCFGLVRLDLGGQEVRVELLHMRQRKVRAEHMSIRSKGTSVLPIYGICRQGRT
jgi:hypothetical protein